MNDLMVANPAREVKSVRQRPKPIYAPGAMELEALSRRSSATTRTATDRMGPRPSDLLGDVVDLILATGARVSEAVGLKWQYVDIDSAQADHHHRRQDRRLEGSAEALRELPQDRVRVAAHHHPSRAPPDAPSPQTRQRRQRVRLPHSYRGSQRHSGRSPRACEASALGPASMTSSSRMRCGSRPSPLSRTRWASKRRHGSPATSVPV